MARLLAACAGPVAALVEAVPGRAPAVMSAIAKTPRSTLEQPAPVHIGPVGLDADEQADPTVHGGLDKAVYLYPSEHLAFWDTVRAQARVAAPACGPGLLGENLHVEGLLEDSVFIGDHLAIGDALLRIESPRQPCFKFNLRMGFTWAARMMVQSGYTGFYCSVVRAGTVCAGDAIAVTPGERHLSVLQAHRLKHRSGQAALF